MSNTKIAIIMSVYRSDKLKWVKECIESILAQSYKYFDIYLQEDGAVSDEIDDYLSDLYTNHTVIYLGKRTDNKGLAYSLNELLSVVIPQNYSFIARMDADDIMQKDRLYKQIEYLEKNSEVDVVGCWYYTLNEDSNYNQVIKLPIDHDSMLAFFARRDALAHPTVMFRLNFFKKAGLYPEYSIRNEDTLLWLTGFKCGCKFANIPEVLMQLRVTNDFYQRRYGFVKAINDYRDRVNIIKSLELPFYNYFFSLAKLCFQCLPSSALYRIVYYYFR